MAKKKKGDMTLREYYGVDKLCSLCQRTLLLDEFSIQKQRGVEILRPDCKSCATEGKRIKRSENQLKGVCKGARFRAMTKGVPFSLTPDWISKNQEVNLCELTGLPFVYGELHSPYARSLDRIIPEDGYTPENTRLVLWALNAGLNNWGEGVYREVAEAYLVRNP